MGKLEEVHGVEGGNGSSAAGSLGTDVVEGGGEGSSVVDQVVRDVGFARGKVRDELGEGRDEESSLKTSEPRQYPLSATK